jgi:hypothetical protein
MPSPKPKTTRKRKVKSVLKSVAKVVAVDLIEAEAPGVVDAIKDVIEIIDGLQPVEVIPDETTLSHSYSYTTGRFGDRLDAVENMAMRGNTAQSIKMLTDIIRDM